MKLTFKVQGSAPEPYVLEFWREGDNLSSSCTCPAGENGMYCKHRLNLIAGDISSLVSKNKNDADILKKMVQGTDVENAINLTRRSEESIEKLKTIFSQQPDRRRSKVDLVKVKSILLQNGFLKGMGATNTLDLFDENINYVGSFKLNASIFKEELADQILDIQLKKIVKPYKGVMSVFYFLSGSNFENLLIEESKLQEYKQKLKVNLRD